MRHVDSEPRVPTVGRFFTLISASTKFLTHFELSSLYIVYPILTKLDDITNWLTIKESAQQI